MSTVAEPILIPGDEACLVLGGISRRTLWTITNRPDNPLPHVRIGSRVMYDVRDLRAWIDAQKPKPAA